MQILTKELRVVRKLSCGEVQHCSHRVRGLIKQMSFVYWFEMVQDTGQLLRHRRDLWFALKILLS